ncbi:TetR-like C-terminal domain-containing protein [Streptomyces sp. NPDC005388]|uniref:TetR-like C-terminal domain-containing protein n=1 Tax=Streptomyces sp. NPDC005388 TaxID=3156717 RepID=UPI0033A2287C
MYRKRENIAAALRRGIQRGDLPHDLDIDLVQDLWAGTILYRRLMTGSPLDTALAEHLVRLVTNTPQLRLQLPDQLVGLGDLGRGRTTGRRLDLHLYLQEQSVLLGHLRLGPVAGGHLRLRGLLGRGLRLLAGLTPGSVIGRGERRRGQHGAKTRGGHADSGKSPCAVLHGRSFIRPGGKVRRPEPQGEPHPRLTTPTPQTSAQHTHEDPSSSNRDEIRAPWPTRMTQPAVASAGLPNNRHLSASPE